MRVIRGTWKPAWQREGFSSFSEWLDIRGNTPRVKSYFEMQEVMKELRT